MVLRDSDSSQCGCLAGEGKDSLGVAGRVCIPHPCRDGSDSEAVCRRTHKTRTLLVVESMECTEGPDHHKCDHVCAGWCVGGETVAVERDMDCGRA